MCINQHINNTSYIFNLIFNPKTILINNREIFVIFRKFIFYIKIVFLIV